MSSKLDKLIIVDVESTCWENNPPPNTPPPGEINEIIEIGVCSLDLETFLIEDARPIFVRPERSKISEFCTRLTTLTQEKIDREGIPFDQACDILKKEYKTRDRVWGSWGDYDRNQFQKQCEFNAIGSTMYTRNYPFGPTHINLKSLFAISHRLHKGLGIDKALELLAIPFTGIHHRGVDDAVNIATIAAQMYKRLRVS